MGKLNTDDLVVRIRELRSQQDKLQERRMEIERRMSDRKVELVDLENVACYVDDLHEILKEGSLAERRTFIRSFVEEISVTGSEALLTYSIPLLPEKVAMGEDEVQRIVQYCGRYLDLPPIVIPLVKS